MIEEVVIQPDIHPLLGRIRGRMGRCLCGEHKYAESLINRNLDRQKEALPPTISIRVQYETIDVCVTAARNEFWKEGLLTINGKPKAGMRTCDFIKLSVQRFDGTQLRGTYSDRFSPGLSTRLERIVHRCPRPFTNVFPQHE